MKKTDKVWEGFRYRALHRITQWKDGCIYRTKQVGFCSADVEFELDKSKWTCSSLSTKLLYPESKSETFEMEPFYSKEEIERLP